VSRNVEIVREAIAAWPRGDRDAILGLMAEDCELFPLRAQLEGTSYRGHEGARRFWDDLHADWEGLELPIDDVREVGDTVVIIGRVVARGRTSGVDLDVPIGQVWELRDGEVTRMHSFSDPADALRAAGLER
jgi:ketosteroid isomerase-like protein